MTQTTKGRRHLVIFAALVQLQVNFNFTRSARLIYFRRLGGSIWEAEGMNVIVFASRKEVARAKERT